MSAAVRVLLSEMEHVHSLATEGERARLRLLAICEAEAERRMQQQLRYTQSGKLHS